MPPKKLNRTYAVSNGLREHKEQIQQSADPGRAARQMQMRQVQFGGRRRVIWSSSDPLGSMRESQAHNSRVHAPVNPESSATFARSSASISRTLASSNERLQARMNQAATSPQGHYMPPPSPPGHYMPPPSPPGHYMPPPSPPGHYMPPPSPPGHYMPPPTPPRGDYIPAPKPRRGDYIPAPKPPQS